MIVSLLLLLCGEAWAASACLSREARRVVLQCAPLRGMLAATPPRHRMAPKPLAPEVQRRLEVLHRQACDGSSHQLAKVRVERALLLAQYQHWELAAVALGQLAFAHGDSHIGVSAVSPYLEALNVLGSHIEPPRVACYDLMEREAARLTERYCPQTYPPMAGSHCRLLRRIGHDIELLEAEQIIKQADNRPATTGQRRYAQAAARYMAIWRRYGEPACRARSDECRRKERDLFNAGRAFQAARMPTRALAAYELLLATDFPAVDDSVLERATYATAAIYQKQGKLRRAADRYERLVHKWPRSAKASDALVELVKLQLRLGHAVKARAAARQLAGRARRARPHIVQPSASAAPSGGTMRYSGEGDTATSIPEIRHDAPRIFLLTLPSHEDGDRQ